MNIVQLQDLLKGLPDNRLKQEMDQPSGTVPQYLVLSEIVRRDKMRTTGMAQSPTTTVVQDVMNQRPGPQAMPPEQMQEEQAPQGFASGGFISAADAMGGAGVRGFAPPTPKPQPMFGPNSGGPGMFTPNTAPKPPAPMTNNNFSISQPQHQFDGGQTTDFNSPSYYQQGAYADGGAIRYDLGGKITAAESGNDPRAKNPRSTATGAGQFIESTWLEVLEKMKPGLINKIGVEAALELRNDPVLSKQATEVYAAGNRDMLIRRGFEPTEGNIYLAHFAGPGGASSLLKADPSTPVAQILGEKVMKANPFLEGMSAADIRAWAEKKMAGKPSNTAKVSPAAAVKPVGLAGRDSPSGLGEGAGLAAIGLDPDARASGIAALIDENDDRIMPEVAELGGALVKNKREAPRMEIPDIAPGSAELAASTRTKSPEEQIAEYASLRRGYMADGGPVRMQDGPPNGDAVRSLTDEEIETYLRNRGAFEQLGAAGKDVFTMIPRALGGVAEDLGIAGLVGSVIGDPGFKFIDPATRDSMTPYSDVLREEGKISGGLFEAPVVTPEKVEEFRATQAAGEPLDTSRSTPMDRNWKPPAKFTQAPRPGIFDEPPEPPKPSAMDTYIAYLQKRDTDLAKLYQDQIAKEEARRAAASGFPAFLRQLGLGMLSDNSSLGNSLQAGLSGAIGTREEEDAAALDRIRALELKRDMGTIQTDSDIAELKYRAEIAKQEAAAKGIPGAADYIPVLDDLLKALSSAEEAADAAYRDRATDPAVIRATQMLNDALSKTGLGGTISTTGQYNWTDTGLEPVK